MKTLAYNSFVRKLHKPMALFMILCLLNSQFLWAVDTTGVAGATQAGNTAGGTDTNVDLGVSGPIINWNNLDTGTNDALNFAGGSDVLNRVADAVIFNGDLNAAGIRVYIVSPNGVHIGSTSTITAAEFIASGLDIANQDFLAGVDKFVPFQIGDGMTQIGEVQNDGTISVTENAALLGSKVLNKGAIVSQQGGLILLATGNKILIGTEGSDVAVEVADSTGPAFEIAPAEGMDAGDVVNRGSITSPAGQIVLAAGDTFVQAIENLNALSGSVEMNTHDVYVEIEAPDIDSENGPYNGDNGDYEGMWVPLVSVTGDGGSATQDGVIDHGGELLAISAVEDVTVTSASTTNAYMNDTDVYLTGENVTLDYKDPYPFESGGDMAILAKNDIVSNRTLVSGGHLAAHAEKGEAKFRRNVESDENMDIRAHGLVDFARHALSEGSMDVTSETHRIQSQGSFWAIDDLTLSAYDRIKLWRYGWTQDGMWDGDQAIVSEEGSVAINAPLTQKISDGQLFIESWKDDGNGNDFDAVAIRGDVETPGNIYIRGVGDVQLAEGSRITGMEQAQSVKLSSDDDLNGYGGVSIISEDGAIYTPDTYVTAYNHAGPGRKEISGVLIQGYSDDTIEGPGYGVDLPYTDSEGNPQGKAAIVLQSKDDLVVNESSALSAHGRYMPMILDPDTGEVMMYGVDDRPGADLLQKDGTIIGGFERNEGIPSDIAIYGASTAGNVEIGTVPFIQQSMFFPNFRSISLYENGPYYRGFPTVVFDAFDTVSLPFVEMLINDPYGYYNESDSFRLEVVSRKTEWLNQAISGGTLPHASDPETVEDLWLIEDYVLRGAGAEDYTRAWVLEDPINQDVAPLAVLEIPELKGCPVEMDAAAAELAMNTDDLQLLIGNSLATNPNLQPCKACQKLVTAASILNDADGARMAAMNQIFNTLAPLDAPFTPELQASVQTAFANMSSENPQYAMAEEYINAFVDYVAVVGEDLQAPVGDPVAFALEKHGEAITSAENPNVAAYVMAQLQASAPSI